MTINLTIESCAQALWLGECTILAFWCQYTDMNMFHCLTQLSITIHIGLFAIERINRAVILKIALQQGNACEDTPSQAALGVCGCDCASDLVPMSEIVLIDLICNGSDVV